MKRNSGVGNRVVMPLLMLLSLIVALVNCVEIGIAIQHHEFPWANLVITLSCLICFLAIVQSQKGTI